MTSPTVEPAARLSALRLVSFIPQERDGVHVGLLSPDAQQVIDLAGLGIADALEALDQLPMLRQAAGAIIHGAARVGFPTSAVHLVAPVPMVRCVVAAGTQAAPQFTDPATVFGPGDSLLRGDASRAQVGLAAIVGETIEATQTCDDATLDRALIGSVLVLGWPHDGPDGPVLRPGAVGPFLAVPRRRPESVVITRVAPLAVDAPPDEKRIVAAPQDDAFFTLARAALRSHTLRPGDLLAIFPVAPEPAERAAALDGAGSWVRVSAPGLGTLSLAVR